MAIWFALFKAAIPELIIISLVILDGIKSSDLTEFWLLFGFSTVLLRAIWNSSMLIHGLGHVVARSIGDRDPLSIAAVNILEHRTLADVWSVAGGKWQCARQNVNHRITHNGDFDVWTIFGKAIENAHLGLWLERVLHPPNATLLLPYARSILELSPPHLNQLELDVLQALRQHPAIAQWTDTQQAAFVKTAIYFSRTTDVHQLLKTYVSKLFALSYRIDSFVKHRLTRENPIDG